MEPLGHDTLVLGKSLCWRRGRARRAMFPGFSRAPRQRGAREEGWDQELAPGKAWAAPLGWKGRGRGADILGELLHPEPLLELGFQVCLALAQILLCDFPSLTTPLWSCRLWMERTEPEQEVRLVFSVRCVVWPPGLGTLSSNTEMMVVPVSFHLHPALSPSFPSALLQGRVEGSLPHPGPPWPGPLRPLDVHWPSLPRCVSPRATGSPEQSS